jgi:glutathione S-transferase
MKLYFHPLSAYSQKALIAFYEKRVDFTPVLVDMLDPDAKAAYVRDVAPLGKVPLLALEEKDWKIPESSIVIEYVETHFASGTKLIPDDTDLARQTRFQDRLADNYLTNPLIKILTDGFRPADKRDALGVEQARAALDTFYALADKAFAKKDWANGSAFSMADCAYAPPLGYLRELHPYAQHRHLTAYFERLAERPSYARVLEEAKPYMARFHAMVAPK